MYGKYYNSIAKVLFVVLLTIFSWDWLWWWSRRSGCSVSKGVFKKLILHDSSFHVFVSNIFVHFQNKKTDLVVPNFCFGWSENFMLFLHLRKKSFVTCKICFWFVAIFYFENQNYDVFKICIIAVKIYLKYPLVCLDILVVSRTSTH